MRLTLVRHIQTLAPEGTCYGRSEPGLPPDHESRHRELARALAGETFHAIYSSPLRRCALLADAIAGGRGVTCDDRLMELDFGLWEGLPWGEIERRPEAAPFLADWVHNPPPGGERFIDLIGRVGAFLGLAERLPPEDFFKRSLNYGQISQVEL